MRSKLGAYERQRDVGHVTALSFSGFCNTLKHQLNFYYQDECPVDIQAGRCGCNESKSPRSPQVAVIPPLEDYARLPVFPIFTPF
jgi:hypothetical protein